MTTYLYRADPEEHRKLYEGVCSDTIDGLIDRVGAIWDTEPLRVAVADLRSQAARLLGENIALTERARAAEAERDIWRRECEAAQRDRDRLREALRSCLRVLEDPAFGGAGYAPFMPGEREALIAARAALAGEDK